MKHGTPIPWRSASIGWGNSGNQIRQKLRKIITSSWNGESPDFREAVTALAAHQPNPEDEPWLQDLACKERRQQTRNSAVAALMQLPDSAFARRSVRRVSPLVGVVRKLLRQVITVEPPQTFDPSWAAGSFDRITTQRCRRKSVVAAAVSRIDSLDLLA